MLSHQRKSRIRTALLALTTALVLASCAGSGGGSQGNANEQQKETGGMADHGPGHMHHGSENGTSGMLMENGRYSDERFIDAMVPHHQVAVEMAQVALENAEHDEIVQLSESIISTQQAEIEELKFIKRDEFGTSRIPMEMSPNQVESMGTMTEPQELADKEPFDKAFIDAMIPHHQSAIEMARVAVQRSENPQVKHLAGHIISAQRSEIEQMEQWWEEWFPQG